MAAQITAVEPGSPAERAGIRVGESLIEVDGNPIADVLDYEYFTYDARLSLILQTAEGKRRKVRIRKGAGEPLGLSFETYLMDRINSCSNHCLFCFVDQLPPGLRESLYFKDDDARLSFLTSSYITMTNLTEREIRRILDLKISPLYISVHASDPGLRCKLLGNRRAGECMDLMGRFARQGITMHCQIVSCRGLNDGEALQETMEALRALHPAVASVSVVPVGLTKHRQGLYPLEPYDRSSAEAVVDRVEAYAARCLAECGRRIFFCSDEFYLKAERALPPYEAYEEFPQLENGVGMLRLMEGELQSALPDFSGDTARPFSVATGLAARPWLRQWIDSMPQGLREACRGVYGIENRFFGDTVDVAGLITGGDLMDQLEGRDLGERLLIPAVMVRLGGDMFLDDVTLAQASERLGVPVIPVESDGYALLCAIAEE